MVFNSQRLRPNFAPRKNSAVLQQNMTANKHAPNAAIRLSDGRLALFSTNRRNRQRRRRPRNYINYDSSSSEDKQTQYIQSQLIRKRKSTSSPNQLQNVINSASETRNVEQTQHVESKLMRKRKNTRRLDYATNVINSAIQPWNVEETQQVQDQLMTDWTTIPLQNEPESFINSASNTRNVEQTPQVQNQLIAGNIKRQCKLLLTQWIKQFEQTKYSWRTKSLIKQLINCRIPTESFIQCLQPLMEKPLPSDLFMFLNKSLPLVRKAIIAEEFSLDSITSSSLNDKPMSEVRQTTSFANNTSPQPKNPTIPHQHQVTATPNDDERSKHLAFLSDVEKSAKDFDSQYVKFLREKLNNGQITDTTFCKGFERTSNVSISADIGNKLDRNLSFLRNVSRRPPQVNYSSQVMPTVPSAQHSVHSLQASAKNLVCPPPQNKRMFNPWKKGK